jgi:hypothetical protein
MGSAFAAEPLYGVDGRKVVTFLMWPSDTQTDLVCHRAHPECPIDAPHRLHECGRFAETKEAP